MTYIQFNFPSLFTPNVTVKYRDLSSGNEISGKQQFTSPVGSLADLNAPQELVGPDPATPYVFRFWNVTGQSLSASPETKFIVSEETVATAYYLPEIGGPGITALAFSCGEDKLLNDTPIQSVNPPGLWMGNNETSVQKSETEKIVITAKDSIASDPGEPFDTWLSFGAATFSDKVLTVPPNGNAWVVASYRAKTFSWLDPNIILPILLKWDRPDPTGIARLAEELNKLAAIGR